VQTPVFMPVGTLASVKGVPQDVLEELGVKILLGNTYHLYLRPGVEQVRKLGGLHRFMSWDRAILTDSGGFQVFSLSELRKLTEEGVSFRSHLDGSTHFLSPEAAISAQIGLGADIIMAFDECTEYPAAQSRVRSSMELTLRWAERSRRYFEEHKDDVPWIRNPVGTAPSLSSAQTRGCPREQSSPDRSEGALQAHESGIATANRLRSLPDVGATDAELPSAGRVSTPAPTWDGMTQNADRIPEITAGQPRAAVPTWPDQTQAVFGIVQGGMDAGLRKESAERTIEIGFSGYAIGGLSVGEARTLTREMVEATVEHLPSDKPRYLMGVGTPEEIVEYANLGIDMMDCVLPTRAARHGLLFTSEGKISIKQARYAGDESPLDPNCGCRVCGRYSRAYLRHLYASNEVLAQVLNTIHNLSFYLDTMRAVRHSIALGDRPQFVSGK
jgi:queuine/archaeosine tRNA-ribosyltransferase